MGWEGRVDAPAAGGVAATVCAIRHTLRLPGIISEKKKTGSKMLVTKIKCIAGPGGMLSTAPL